MQHHMTGDGMEAISDCRTLGEVIARVYGDSISVADKKRGITNSLSAALK